jgi:hypothetical protein
MSLHHTIRSKSGGFKDVSLTPLQAIRYQCLECNGWDDPVKEDCGGIFCSLYPYRGGTNPERKGTGVIGNTRN